MSRNLFIIVLLIITPFCGWGQVDTIADQKLQEVVIMAKLPTVEMKPGKMTYRLDASITQSQGNVYDVLTSLPGIDTKRWHYFLEWSKRSEYLDGW